MREVTAFASLCRSGLNNPDSFEKRLRQFKIAIERAIKAEDGDFEGLCHALCAATEEEIERFQRNLENTKPKLDGPTRQTVAKRGIDPVIAMINAGTLSKDDEKTIQELRELRQKLSSGLTGSGGQIGERVDTSTTTFTHPIERLTTRQDLMLTHVYRPWHDSIAHAATQVGESRFLNISPFELVISVIQNGVPLGEIETKYHVRHGALTKPMVNALRDFAVKLAKAEHEGKVPRVGE